ncbi:hypothetical protein EJ08DRAFT_659838 [Tothia fuscella]|uniref:Uncharacterized protein n=1 Tax=Tothia fuscella TaxID=1048955 RepID=A0A9P4TZL4_9PEZI|nr:hypothetical protein EJ08DRAFT_659838 [Tothia fuscella]
MHPRDCSYGPTTTTTTSQLRRAKSAPLVQRRSSVSSLIDPVAAKQHAIVAATVAYERSHRREHSGGTEQAAGGECTRRRSNRTRRHENQSQGQGSHFEANHAPRRQSSKKLPSASGAANDHARARRATVSSVVSSSPGVVSHPRSVDVVEYSKMRKAGGSGLDGERLSSQQVRKTRSMMYASSRTAPDTSIDSISFANASTPKKAFAPTVHGIDDTTLLSITEQDVTLDSTVYTIPPAPLTNSAIYKVDEKVAKARDHHLQQFQMGKIRHRASLMLTPFKKRVGSGSSTGTAPLSGISNNGVTYASERSLPLKENQSVQRKVSNERSESRQSTSLKDKIKRVFRKPSGLQIGLPIQQVHATKAHFGDLLSTSSSRLPTPRGRIPNKNNGVTTPPQRFPIPQAIRSTSRDLTRGGSPTASEHTVMTSTSRVTSWADSTVAGTATSRDSHRLTIIHEDQHQPEQSQPEVASLRSQKRKPSLGFFRRIPKSVAVECAKPFPEFGMSTSQSIDLPQTGAKANIGSLTSKGSIHETLPSQVRRASFKGKALAGPSSTVRAVSNSSQSVGSANGDRIRTTSGSSSIPPVVSQLADTMQSNQSQELFVASTSGNWISRKRNRLPKPPPDQTCQVVQPSAAQIAHRVERSNDRWKQSLEESRSLFYPRSRLNTAKDEDNVSSPISNGASSAEDIFQTVREPPLVRPIGVISPSLYSRNTNSVSPRKSYKVHYHGDDTVSLRSNSSHETGTAVITKSQPIVKYPVGSPSRLAVPQIAKTSGDWRDWISKEIADLATPTPEDFTLGREYISTKRVDSQHRREHAQIIDREEEDSSTIDFGEIGSTSAPHTGSPVRKVSTRPSLRIRPSSQSAVIESIEPEVEILLESRPQPPNVSSTYISHERSDSRAATVGSMEPKQSISLPYTPHERSNSRAPTVGSIEPKQSIQSHAPSSRYAPDDRPSSRLHDRPLLKNRSASAMNERFPLIDTGRPPSRQRKSATPSESVRSKNTENTKPKESRETGNTTPSSVASSFLQVPVFVAKPARATLRRNQSTSSFPRSKSSLAQYTTTGTIENINNNINYHPIVTVPSPSRAPSYIPRPNNNSVTSLPRPSNNSVTSLHRPKSSIDIRASNRRTTRTTQPQTPTTDNDPTLAAIFRGPYRSTTASPKPLSIPIRKTASFYKENTPFAIPSTTRNNHARENDGEEDALPATPASGGQRLAEQFLNARRLREDMRVSESPTTLGGSPLFL